MRKSAVRANDPVAREAAEDALRGGASAVAAALTGYFASSGAYAGVLLSPACLLVAGVGTPARVFDGRSRQPGNGLKRPRGFTSDEPIPEAARLAVPSAPLALLVAHAFDGGQSLGTLLKPGIQLAKRAGSPDRAALLRRIRELGAGAFRERRVVSAFQHLGGPSEGGQLSPKDFEPPEGLEIAAELHEHDGGGVAMAPWHDEGVADPRLGISLGLCAVDLRGQVAALSYYRVTEGVVIDDLELEAPAIAEPVLRGVSRVTPGSALPAPCPAALRREGDANWIAAYASPAQPRLDLAELEAGLWVRREASGLTDGSP